ncbi:hypothetical protein U9M48_003637 [Paspalum notatum var. saurae]|uniref:Uncharacterized protein n=1 Tax=Paspalum notatum var. saurae TaxID=547442 RepID=A0AAQ3SK12_PASNO
MLRRRSPCGGLEVRQRAAATLVDRCRSRALGPEPSAPFVRIGVLALLLNRNPLFKVYFGLDPIIMFLHCSSYPSETSGVRSEFLFPLMPVTQPTEVQTAEPKGVCWATNRCSAPT